MGTRWSNPKAGDKAQVADAKNTPELTESAHPKEIAISTADASSVVATCTVVVTTLGGSTLQIEASSDTTVLTIKQEIERRCDVALADQRLLYGIRELLDTELISSFLADSDSVDITLVKECCLSGPLSSCIDASCLYLLQPVWRDSHRDAQGAQRFLDVVFNRTPMENSPGISLFRPCIRNDRSPCSMGWRMQILDDGDCFARLSPALVTDDEDIALDLTNPSHQLCLRTWGNYTGQRWNFEEVSDGYRISTKWTPDLYLTLLADGKLLAMRRWNDGQSQETQVWSLRKCRRIVEADSDQLA